MMMEEPTRPNVKMLGPLSVPNPDLGELLVKMNAALELGNRQVVRELGVLCARVSDLHKRQATSEQALLRLQDRVPGSRTIQRGPSRLSENGDPLGDVTESVNAVIARATELCSLVHNDRTRRLLGLIQMSDRLRTELRDHDGQSGAREWLASIRRADLEELEAAISAFGMEKYTTPDRALDAAKQQLVTFPTKNEDLFGKLRQRLHPGWRTTDGALIRKEIVAIWAKAKKGEEEC